MLTSKQEKTKSLDETGSSKSNATTLLFNILER